MSPRRREDRDRLRPALNAEALLTDLLERGEAGNLPLATDDEARAWHVAWAAQHPGDTGADPRSPMWHAVPRGVIRRDAITYVEVILPAVVQAKLIRVAGRAAAWAREHPKRAASDPASDAAQREALAEYACQLRAEALAEARQTIRAEQLGDLARIPAALLAVEVAAAPEGPPTT